MCVMSFMNCPLGAVPELGNTTRGVGGPFLSYSKKNSKKRLLKRRFKGAFLGAVIEATNEAINRPQKMTP